MTDNVRDNRRRVMIGLMRRVKASTAVTYDERGTRARIIKTRVDAVTMSNEKLTDFPTDL